MKIKDDKNIKGQFTEEEIETFTKNSVINKSFNTLSKGYSISLKMSKQQINKFLRNPVKNYKELQEISEFLYTSNGIYYQLINYMATLTPFYGNLYPIDYFEFKSKSKKNKIEDYYKISYYLNKLNLNYYLPKISLALFKTGEIYLYELENKNGYLLIEFPSYMCKATGCKNINGGIITTYAIDLNQLSNNNIKSFPKEIQIAYQLYKNKIIKNNWYQISNKGIAFIMQDNKEHGVPPYAFLFNNLIDLDNIKDLKKKTDALDALKMIHYKVPIDPKSGKPIMDITLTKEYIKNTKDGTPEGTFVTTNPFEAQSLSFNNTSVQQKNLEKDSIDSIYQYAGISDLLFRNENSSAEALKRSIIVDTQFIYNNIFPKMQCFINYKLSKVDTQISWGYYLLKVSYHNIEDAKKDAFNNLAKGASRTEAQVLSGKTPLESINIMSFERDIDIDEIMKPQLTGNVMSGKDEDKKGRPEKEEKSDNTEKANESQ